MTAPLSDVQLVEKAQKGGRMEAEKAFEELLDRCGRPSLELIRTKIFSEQDREDVRQDWREIAWKNIGKFDTRKFERYTPFLTGAAVLAIHRFLSGLGKWSAAKKLLQQAIKDPQIAFFPGGQQVPPSASSRLRSHRRYVKLIQGVLGAGLDAHLLLAFLLIDCLDENPATPAGVSDKNAPRKIASAYWNVPFHRLKKVFLVAYAAESEIPFPHVQSLFADLDKTLSGAENKCFADFGGKNIHVRALYDWAYKARTIIIQHLSK